MKISRDSDGIITIKTRDGGLHISGDEFDAFYEAIKSFSIVGGEMEVEVDCYKTDLFLVE